MVVMISQYILETLRFLWLSVLLLLLLRLSRTDALQLFDEWAIEEGISHIYHMVTGRGVMQRLLWEAEVILTISSHLTGSGSYHIVTLPCIRLKPNLTIGEHPLILIDNGRLEYHRLSSISTFRMVVLIILLDLIVVLIVVLMECFCTVITCD